MSIPFQSIHFATYEAIKKILNPSGRYDPKTHVVAGGLAGATAAFFTQPLDVAKTLLQTRGLSTEASVRKIQGIGGAFKEIYRRYGWQGFFRGVQPRILTNMPATAISWTTVSSLSCIKFSL
jgi:solute carrier family 25 iron transporter 28/37